VRCAERIRRLDILDLTSGTPSLALGLESLLLARFEFGGICID
jgi:hypothetical protein